MRQMNEAAQRPGHRRSIDIAGSRRISIRVDAANRHSPGAIRLSSDGRFLYVTDRGEANRILVYAIAADGRLQLLQKRDSEGREPRELAIAPDGRFLLVANQFGDSLVVFRRDPASGW